MVAVFYTIMDTINRLKGWRFEWNALKKFIEGQTILNLTHPRSSGGQLAEEDPG
jgi:hypothetical protein